MAKTFPISFKFKAFERITPALKRIRAGLGKLKGRLDSAGRGFDKLRLKAKRLSKTFGPVGKKIGDVGKKMTAFVTAPLALLGLKFVKTAADAEETSSKFGEVFKEIDQSIRQSAIKGLQDEFKLAEATAKDFLSTSGLIAKGLGFTSEEALGLAEKLTGVATDLVSFRNISGGSERVVRSFNSALLGERESLKSLGIVFLDHHVKSRVLELQQKGQTFRTMEQAKAMATLSLIMERTKDDQGDFARTIQSLSNQVRVASERFKEVSKVIGDILSPYAAKIVDLFNKLMNWFLKLSPATQKFIVATAALAAVMGPLLIVVGSLVAAWPYLAAAWGAITLKTALLTGGISLLIAGLGLLYLNWDKITNAITSNWGPRLQWILNIAKRGINAVGGLFGKQFFDTSASGPSIAAADVGKGVLQKTESTNNARVQLDFNGLPKGTDILTESTGPAPLLNLGAAGGVL